MRPRHLLVIVLLSAGAPACANAPPPARTAAADVDARDAWASLQRGLPGTWVATSASGRSVEVSYRLVSRGSALLETFGAAGPAQTVSVVHPDGRALQLTHYCAQGNQARLRATAVSPGRVIFTEVDATNVGPGQSVLHDLVLELGADTLTRTEIYRAPDGTPETTVLRFTRRPGAT